MVLSVTGILVDLSVTIMKVTASVAIMQLEVSAAHIQVAVSADGSLFCNYTGGIFCSALCT